MFKICNHLNNLSTYHNKLGNTLNTVVNHYNRTSDEFKKIDKDVMKISEGKFNIDFQKQLIDKTRDND